MKTKLELDEIEKRIDYESLIKKLDALSVTGEFSERRKVTDLLDKLKPALLRAREKHVPIRVLAKYVIDSGIPLTEATFRKYLAGYEPKKKKSRAFNRKKSKPETSAGTVSINEVTIVSSPVLPSVVPPVGKPAIPVLEKVVPESGKLPEKILPPRLARRNK